MKIFGFSLMTVFLFLLFFWFGTKNPGALSRVPIIGSL